MVLTGVKESFTYLVSAACIIARCSLLKIKYLSTCVLLSKCIHSDSFRIKENSIVCIWTVYHTCNSIQGNISNKYLFHYYIKNLLLVFQSVVLKWSLMIQIILFIYFKSEQAFLHSHFRFNLLQESWVT